jgi:hypothetical protein
MQNAKHSQPGREESKDGSVHACHASHGEIHARLATASRYKEQHRAKDVPN